MGGSSGGGGGSTQTIQKADPWSGQQPYLTRGFKDIQDLFLDTAPPEYFPGSTVTPFSPETNTSLQLRTMRALQGSPVQDAANNEMMKTLNGDYLYGGQGFNAAFDAASRRIMPMVSSSFEKSGRTGSGLAGAAMTRELGDSFAGLYDNERQNQMRSMLAAPSAAAQDYADIDQLGGVGSTLEGQQGAYTNDAKARWDYAQNIKQQQLAQYMNLIQGNYGETKTTTGPAMTNNSGAGMLGGALAGAGLAGKLGATMGGAGLMGGYGLALGGLGGALLGGGWF